MPYEIATGPFVRFFQRKGVKVHVWTVNDTSKIQRSLDIGVDGIIGDYPDRIYSVMKDGGYR